VSGYRIGGGFENGKGCAGGTDGGFFQKIPSFKIAHTLKSSQ
jgi:hypothetical protein